MEMWKRFMVGLLLESHREYGGRVIYQVYGDTRCSDILSVWFTQCMVIPGAWCMVWWYVPVVWKWTNAMLWNRNAGVGLGWGCMAIWSECMAERASEIWGSIIYYTYTVYASYRRLWMYIEWGAFAIGAGWSTNHLPALFQISILYRAGRSYKKVRKLDLSKLCEFCIKSCAERRKMTAVNWTN